MSYRMRKAGYKLCYSPDIVFYQQTRSTLPKMLKQKFLNGYWIGKTLGISPNCFSLFHFVPFAFVVGIIITSILCFLNLPFLANLMWFTYLLLLFVITVIETVKKPKLTNLFLPIIFLLLHLSYGIGTLVGIIELPFWLIKIKKTH